MTESMRDKEIKSLAEVVYEMADMLDRDKAIDAIAEVIRHSGVAQSPLSIDKAPKTGERLLLFPSVNVHDSCSIGYWNDDFGWMVGGSPAGIEITHWLPLPPSLNESDKPGADRKIGLAVVKALLSLYLPAHFGGDGKLEGEEAAVPVEEERKMWLIVRKDLLKLDIPGVFSKMLGQSGHGFLNSWIRGLLKSSEETVDYLQIAQPKIVVGVNNEAQLIKAYEAAEAAGLPCALIKDAARTVFTEATYTVACVGPCYRDELPKRVEKLQLLQF